ncbi:MAG: NAD(P)/FAD-dependent oxidoreductase, partial [Anaerolineaceae bacterium]|nr:NAD(P)/FAD-dependent oxidoreductase [Anaerolineaceae bacterium]
APIVERRIILQSLHETTPRIGDDDQQKVSGRPSVVVLGAGFGGLWAARTLADGAVDVLLVDRHNYHTFFPLLYQVGAAELEPEEIAHPLRKIFWKRPNVRFYLGEVQNVDISAKVVSIPGHELHYDYLVIALGSQPNFYGIPGAVENAFTLKSIDQGMALRNQILTCFERAACEVDPARQQAWLTFTIVGGGPTGVEFSGALMELIHGSLRKDFPGLTFARPHALLLEASDHLLTGMPDSLSQYAQTRLQKMGVDVRLNSQVVKLDPHEVILKDGTIIPSRTVVWLAGVHGNPLVNQWGLPTNRHGQVELLPTLQAPGHPEVYVVGDLASIQQDGQPLPLVAQGGIQTGTTAGRNILRQIAGQPLAPFRYHDKGTLDVIGRNAAAAYIWRRAFKGFPAWLIWVGVHIFNLIGFRNRLLVLVDWAWEYFFYEHGVRLIVQSELPPASGRAATRDSHPARALGGDGHPRETTRERSHTR